MQPTTNAMSNKFSHNREAISLDTLLNCGRYIAKTVANTGVAYSCFKGDGSRL